jgi:hypothetical protein
MAGGCPQAGMPPGTAIPVTSNTCAAGSSRKASSSTRRLEPRDLILGTWPFSDSAWPPTEHKVREGPDRLNEAAEHPEWLGSAHLIRGPPGEVNERNRSENQLHGARGDDQPLLGACQVTPLLFRSHDQH